LEFRRAVVVGGVDHVGLNGEIIEKEISGTGAVGQNAAHLGRGEKDVLGAFGGEESMDGGLIAQVELAAAALNHVAVSELGQPSREGGPHQAVMARYENLTVFVHSF